MQRSMLILSAAAALAIPAAIALADPPANDSCSLAQQIGLGAMNGTNVQATVDGSDSCRGATGPDVWFRYYATCAELLRVDTCGSALDTVVSVHTGCPGSPGNELACNDDAVIGPCPGGLSSYVEVTVIPGIEYYIRVAGYGNAVGMFRLNLSMAGLSNDACATPVPVGEGQSVVGRTCGASSEFVDGACGLSSWCPDVWFSFTPACSGMVTMDLCGSVYDTVLGLYSGECGALVPVACNDDASPPCPSNSVASRITASVTGGQTYRIRVAGYFEMVGDYQLNVGTVTVPNDSCTGATVVGNGVYAGSTCAATADGSASCGWSSAAADVWYLWTAPVAGNLVLNTCGSSYDTVVSAYSGVCGALTEIGCNDDDLGIGPCGPSLQSFLSVPVLGGQAYYIRVSGYAGDKGDFYLSIHQQPNDPCRDALAAQVGSVAFDTRGATTDGAAGCGQSNASPDIWYEFVAPCRGSIEIDTCGSAFDTVLAAYTGVCGAAVEVACNDDAYEGACAVSLQSHIAFPAAEAQPFLVRVSGFEGASGTGWMNIAMICDCDPDVNCDGAINGFDIEAMEQAVNGDMSNFCQADPDYNHDGAVNGFDIEAVEQGVNGAPCP